MAVTESRFRVMASDALLARGRGPLGLDLLTLAVLLLVLVQLRLVRGCRDGEGLHQQAGGGREIRGGRPAVERDTGNGPERQDEATLERAAGEERQGALAAKRSEHIPGDPAGVSHAAIAFGDDTIAPPR